MKISQIFAAILLAVFISSGYADAAPDRSVAAYKQAADYYHKLGGANKNVSRRELERNLEMFKAIYKKYPRGAKTPEALFMSGQLHGDLYTRYHRKVDKQNALTIYRVLVRTYPDHALADDALYNSGELRLKDGDKVEAVSDFRGLLSWFPKGDRVAVAKTMIDRLQGEIRSAKYALPKVKVKSAPDAEASAELDFKRVRYWANDSYARVVLDMGKRIHYKIERDEAQNRIIVDLLGAQGAGSFEKSITPPSGLVQSIEIGSPNHEISRVIIALKSGGSYSTMELSNPERIVIDINTDKESAPVEVSAFPAQETAQSAAQPLDQPAANQADSLKAEAQKPAIVAKGLSAPKVGVDLNAPVINPLPPVTAAAGTAGDALADLAADDAGLAEAGLIDSATPVEPTAPHQSKDVKKASFAPIPDSKTRTIVIDPGHGGKDPGAIGRGGLREKDVALDIALRLEKLLKTNCNCRVLLTRSTDIFIPLEERTAFANTNDADLFISIHANSSKKRNVSGVETYFLSPARSKDEGYVAAQENMMNMESDNEDTNDLAFILYDMQSTDKINESSRMAAMVQHAVVKGLKPGHRPYDHGVKQAMFYVLHGARMPSVLVETSFISNAKEEKLLRNAAYRQKIAEGIADGVTDYRRETQMAFLAN
ncbi:MAG: N-acetylmuramoyl-L-alanine amidase [Nitrospinae bacterium]|nr:N-acetylmuramoyl-L-alanine amidase [Nitrospinota bacterium]